MQFFVKIWKKIENEKDFKIKRFRIIEVNLRTMVVDEFIDLNFFKKLKSQFVDALNLLIYKFHEFSINDNEKHEIR